MPGATSGPDGLPAGRAIRPGDLGYDRARAAWNRNIDQHPVAIVRPRDADDVVAAVRYAARRSLPVAVQGTGHGAVLPCDGAVLVDTSAFDDISVDPVRRVARAAPGAIWKPLMKASEAHGLAGLAGFNDTVGVLGYTLGGGYGWLSRRHGLACDSIVGADLVLADGSAVRVTPSQHPDLLWALRGGAGNVGIVTALEIGLVPLASAYGGMLTFPLERARELLHLFAEATRDADPRLTTAIRLSRIPQTTLVAKVLGGRPAVSVMLCFLGEQAEGRALTRRWVEAGPAHGRLRAIGPGRLGTIEGAPPKGVRSVQVGEQLARLDEPSIEALAARFEPDDAPIFLVELRHVGGAAGQGGDAVFDRRDGQYLLHLESAAGDGEERGAALAWLDGTRDLLAPVLAGSAAPGFVGDGERALAATRRTVSDAHRHRLAAIKGRHDPENRFRFNVGEALR